jgi:anti-sigma factor RsiW
MRTHAHWIRQARSYRARVRQVGGEVFPRRCVLQRKRETGRAKRYAGRHAGQAVGQKTVSRRDYERAILVSRH